MANRGNAVELHVVSDSTGETAARPPLAPGAEVPHPAVVRGRQFTPRLERTTHQPLRWHLVVLVESVPCFSGHYPSERAALAAWTQFQRDQHKRPGSPA